MGCRHATTAARALLSSAAASATSRVLSRRLIPCSWHRGLATSTLPTALLSNSRTQYPLLHSSHYHGRSCNGRRSYSSAHGSADIAVLGGGLTGLSTAYYLAKKLPSTANITLYEGSDRLGGWVRTERHPVDIGGKKGTVLFERGPRSLTSLVGNYWRYDDLVLYDLCLDLGLNLSSPPSMPRYIYYPDHLVPLPPYIGLFQIFNEPLYRESIPAAIALFINSLFNANDPSKVPSEDLSISEWMYSISKSRHAAATLASAMVHGIYGGDIDKLSARTVFDRIFWGWYLPNQGNVSRPMPEPEEKILDTLGKDKQIQKMALKARGALYDFGAAGMQSLPDAMAAALEEQPNVTIKLNTPITSLSQDEGSDKIIVNSAGNNGQPSTHQKVISTLTAQDLARAAGGKLPTLEKSHSVDVMTVNLWFPEENIKPPGTGYLIPRTVPAGVNPDHVLGVFFDSDVQTRGPDEPAGTKLFVLMGGHYYDQPGVSPPTEAEAIRQARHLLERHLGISRNAPCHAVARLAKQCIPQHYVDHSLRMTAAQSELSSAFKGRLAVAGGSYTRIGAVAALRAGYDVADQMTKDNWLDLTGIEDLASGAFAFSSRRLEDIPVRR